MIEFVRTNTAQAPIETVFDVMTDHRNVAATTALFRRSTIDREGVPAPNGVGTIRRLASYGTTFIEEILEYERPTHWAYQLRSGAPTRDHIGTIDLRETDVGTEVKFRLTAEVVVPGIEPLAAPMAKWFIDRLVKDSIRAAERRGSR